MRAVRPAHAPHNASPTARIRSANSRVRSTMSSRSNSASAAKIPNTRRPFALVVSISAASARRARADPRLGQGWTIHHSGRGLQQSPPERGRSSRCPELTSFISFRRIGAIQPWMAVLPEWRCGMLHLEFM